MRTTHTALQGQGTNWAPKGAPWPVTSAPSHHLHIPSAASSIGSSRSPRVSLRPRRGHCGRLAASGAPASSPSPSPPSLPAARGASGTEGQEHVHQRECRAALLRHAVRVQATPGAPRHRWRGLSSDGSSACCSHPGPAAGGPRRLRACALRGDVWPQGEGNSVVS